MKLNCYSYLSICELEKFEINNIKANIDDFGINRDVEPKKAPDYGCGNKKFIPNIPPAQKVLDKYKISANEYIEVCEKLDQELSFGNCSLCV